MILSVAVGFSISAIDADCSRKRVDVFSHKHVKLAKVKNTKRRVRLYQPKFLKNQCFSLHLSIHLFSTRACCFYFSCLQSWVFSTCLYHGPSTYLHVMIPRVFKLHSPNYLLLPNRGSCTFDIYYLSYQCHHTVY